MKKFSFNQKALSAAAAHQILSNVFHVCDIEPNSVPLSSIFEYSNYRKQRFVFHRTTIYTVLAVFLLLPVLFITGTIIWTLNRPDSTYTVTTDSIIPADSVNATIDGHSVAATLQDDGTFLLSPSRNGLMTITLTLKNRQEITTEVNVSSIDDIMPVLDGISYSGEYICLKVYDADSGINGDRIRITLPDESEFTGWEYDAEEGTLKIPYPDDIITVYIPDMNGNTLRLQLCPT